MQTYLIYRQLMLNYRQLQVSFPLTMKDSPEKSHMNKYWEASGCWNLHFNCRFVITRFFLSPAHEYPPTLICAATSDESSFFAQGICRQVAQKGNDRSPEIQYASNQGQVTPK